MKPLRLFGAVLCASLLTGCDPVHDVGFINTSAQPVMVDAFITQHFQTQPSMILRVTPGKDSTWARFVIQPGDTVICGMTIAEIDDEMPFTKLHIYSGQDSIIADSEEEVKDLFSRMYIGSPYLIELE